MVLTDRQLIPLTASFAAAARAFTEGSLDQDSLDFVGKPDDVTVYGRFGSQKFSMRLYTDSEGEIKHEFYRHVSDI